MVRRHCRQGRSVITLSAAHRVDDAMSGGIFAVAVFGLHDCRAGSRRSLPCATHRRHAARLLKRSASQQQQADHRERR